jgi:hypothetical protein
MDHFAGLDVSVKETSICIVDDSGRIMGRFSVFAWRDCLRSTSGATVSGVENPVPRGDLAGVRTGRQFATSREVEASRGCRFCGLLSSD